MLKCRDIGHQASDYADGAMTWRQSLGYGFHLLLCGHCRTFVRHLHTTIAFTRALPEKESLSDEQVAAIAAKAIDAVGASPARD
ncbi:MAG: hypothetical protein A3H44_00695 [Gammaproteobacteria bacterium RIFCSPLOWO2_02_FULL_57_10]|nr:MAG: hypothetical protein A3H44_00695 [Gammaproteobacteria bacterium RIFCSPLOWO2_02_FULL_57_10]